MENFIESLKGGVDAFEDVEIAAETDFKSVPDWDSVSLLSVIAVISADFGVVLNSDDVLSAPSVGALWELVQSRRV